MSIDDLDKLVAQRLADGEKSKQLKASLAFGLDQNPDERAKAQKLGQPFGARPEVVMDNMSAFERSAFHQSFDYEGFLRDYPVSAGYLSNPDNAALAHDDITTLAEIERAVSRFKPLDPKKYTPSQIQAIQEERRRISAANLGKGEFNAALANLNTGAISPLAGVVKPVGHSIGAVEKTLGLLPELLNRPGSIDSTLNAIKDVWTKPVEEGDTGTIGGSLATGAGKVQSHYAEPIKAGVQKLLVDPATGQQFENPDHSFFGRDTGNSLMAVPGTMAIAALTGKYAAPVFSTHAAVAKTEQAIKEGATPGAAIYEGLGSGALNALLMTQAPAPIPTRTGLGDLFQAGARGAVLGTGMTVGENLLARTHDPNRDLYQGLGENLANFTAFEAAHLGVQRLVELSSTSKLKARSPEAFQSAAETILKGSGAEEVLVPLERFQTYFQEAGMDPAKVAEQLGVKNYAEALAAGTDLRVPTSEALAKLSDAHLRGLAPDMRLESDAMTPRQAAELVQGAPDRVAKLVEEARATLPDPEFQAFSEIKAQVQKRLEATGRFTPALAEDNAALVAKGIVSQGLREGMDPLKILGDYGLNIIGPEDAKVSGTTYAQPGAKRGFITFGENNKVSIAILEKANASTFVHELGHFWLKMQADLAQRPEASEQVKADMAAILKWMGLESPDQIGTTHHEQFARAHEAFLREGKAPSQHVAATFARFKTWLSAIYRKLTDLNVNLTDDVRGVFGRIYASDAEIRAAKDRMGGDRALFESADKAGMTEAEFKAYRDLGEQEHQTGKATLDARLHAEADRTKLQWWKDEISKVREEVAPSVDADPSQRAVRALSEGHLEDGTPIKLSREDLVRQFGEEVLKELPHRGAKWLYAKEGGMDAEAAAELLGFDSGAKLVEALKGAAPRETVIQAEAERIMRERHGDMLTDGSIAQAAVEALHNQPREARLLLELKALRKKQEQTTQGRAEARATVKEVPHIQTFRDAAKEVVGGSLVRDLDPWRYLQASRKASRESFEAMAKDQYAAAGDAKQKEILNHHLFLEATKAKQETAKIFAYGREGQLPKFQGILGRAGREFQDQWNALASRYEFRKVTNKELDQRTQTLAEWAKEHAEDGALIDPSVLKEGQAKNWREVPVSELRAVRDALVNIETVARHQLGVELEGRKLEYDKEIAQFEQVARSANASKVTPRRGTKLSGIEESSSKLQGLNAYMQKMEWFIDKLDGGDINGPARRNIKKPIDDAAGREKQMAHDIKLKLVEVFKGLTPADRAREYDSVDVQFPRMDRPMNRMQLFSWALNLGTAENRKVAILGEELMNGDGSLKPEFNAALGKLTLKDCQRIQGIWDALESMRPEIIAKERRVTGIEPKWKEVIPLTVHTADGHTVELKGGYYPLKADTEVSSIGKRQMNPTIHEGTFTRPSVSDSHTQTVTGATYPLLLDYAYVLGQHLPAVIKNVTTGEAISYVSKFIMNDKVSGTIRETLGPAKEKEFLPWLQSFASNGVDSSQSGPIVRFLMSRRMGMVVARLGGNLTSYIAQAGDSFKLLTEELSLKHWAQAQYDIRRNPKAMIEEIRRLSPNEMRFREQDFNREIREELQAKPILDATKHNVSEFLMSGFGVMDKLQSFPAWLARYRQGMEAHGNEAQAIMEADRLISRAMQAGEARNMSRLMREPGAVKLFTTFGGDANTWYGILSSAFESKNVRRISFALLAAIGEQMFTQAAKGRLPKKDEYGEWSLEQSISALLNPLSIFGDFADYGVKKASGKYAKFNNPTLDALEKAFALPADVKAFKDGKKDAQQLGIDAVDAVGMWAGIPGTGQLVKSWKYQHDLKRGKQPRPSSKAGELKNTLLGPPPKEK